MSKLLIVENCNFKDYPTGGTLSFARQLIQELPSEKVALIGITTEDLKIGEWTPLKIFDQSFEFFPIFKLNPDKKKPLIPLRLISFLSLLYYLRKIRKRPYRFVFTQTPQFIFALSLFQWNSICFCFAGLGNSVKLSRYRSLRFLGGIYETMLLWLLNRNADCVLAAADNVSIEAFKLKHKSIFSKEITSFPTRFDKNIFYPSDKKLLRNKLKLPFDKTILVTTGRLCWIKGWDLLLEVLLLRVKETDTLLIFVGDGEDRNQIEKRYPDLSDNHIMITGFVDTISVAKYLNASDVFILGSYTEGWSTSLIEALACGKPIVTTDVSSASDIVREGVTGFIAKDRSPEHFNKLIDQALELNNVKSISDEMAIKYAKQNLYSDFTNNWVTVKTIFL